MQAEGVIANEQELATLKQLTCLVEERSKYYGKAILKFGFLREKEALKVSAGIIIFTPKGHEMKEEKRDYGSFVLITKLLEPTEVCVLLEEIVEKRTLSIPDLPSIQLKGRLDQTIHFIPSMGQYGCIRSEWPGNYCKFDIQQESRGYPPRDLPAKLEYPLYPHGEKALIDFLELKTQYFTESFIAILVPDYRSRIRNLTIAGKKVRTDIESREVSLKDLVTKFYCEADSRSYHSENISCEKGYAEFEIDREPTRVLVHLLDSASGEDLDNRMFDYRWGDYGEGITIERSEMEVREIIRRGENENVEFKRDLTSPDDFLDTIVAFSNSSGGTIFLGVDDDTGILGFVEKDKDRITNLIASNIEPTMQPRISTFALSEKLITLISIPEGNDKPYSHRERGVYVRKGATDRHATRIDLDAIYSKRQSTSSFYR